MKCTGWPLENPTGKMAAKNTPSTTGRGGIFSNHFFLGGGSTVHLVVLRSFYQYLKENCTLFAGLIFWGAHFWWF